MHPVVTGVERFTQQTYLELSRLTGEDQLLLFKPQSTNRYLQHLWTYTTLPRLARVNNCAAMYCSSNAAPFKLANSIRLVVTIHDISFIGNPKLYSAPFREYYKLVLPKIIARADAITTVSNNELERIAGYFPSAAGKITVVYPGIEVGFTPRSGESSKTILVVGSTNRHKNLSRLLRAFKSLLNRTEHNLVIIGGRRDAISTDKDIEREIASIPPSRIMLLGHVSEDELRRAYQSADIFVFPSLWEGFGAVPLEAMACGCPVLASNRSAIPEVCGDAAYYFNPEDEAEIAEAIFAVLSSDAIKNRLRKAGYRRSGQFSYAHTAASIHNLLVG
jgi:glycosyltransferase involved in cell wall biosynthesis